MSLGLYAMRYMGEAAAWIFIRNTRHSNLVELSERSIYICAFL